MVFRYTTRHPVHQIRTEMDRLINGLGRATGWPMFDRGQPALSVWEEGDVLQVEMELPGVKAEHVDISASGGELLIKVERPESDQEGVVYHRRERTQGESQRVLRLPADVDTGKVEARLHDGILTITLPKAENAKPRKINVTT